MTVNFEDKDRERFWKNTDVRSSDECWIWKRSVFRFGHGRFTMDSKNMQAHRAAWMLIKGEIPDGLCVLHRCDNPPCVNPRHLFLGTQLDNLKDRDDKLRTARGQRGGRAKLTEQDVFLIRSAAGIVPQSALATQFGVCQASISLIVHRKTWAHIGGD
jgi:hypothetical protein